MKAANIYQISLMFSHAQVQSNASQAACEVVFQINILFYSLEFLQMHLPVTR